MTRTLKRRIAALEAPHDAIPAPRLIVLTSPGADIVRLRHDGCEWSRQEGESPDSFQARVLADLGDGPPLLLAGLTT